MLAAGTPFQTSALEKSCRHCGHHLAAAIVKGFGCRPLTGVRHTPAAGVRKPPKDETAMGSGWRCRGHYGDWAAATEEVGCRRGDGSQRWLACGCVIGWLLRLLKYLHGSNDEGRSND